MSTVEEKTAAAKKESSRRTRRTFLIGGLSAAAGYEFYRWLGNAPGDEMLPRPLRKTLNFNAALSRGVFDERALAPTYPAGKAEQLRINGNFGLKQKLEMSSYRLQVVGVEGAERYPQYVKDVTAWQYQYAGDTDTPTGPEVKEAPKAANGGGGGDAGTAKMMSKGAAGGPQEAGKKPAGPADGGAQAGPPKGPPGEGPGRMYRRNLPRRLRRHGKRMTTASRSGGRKRRGKRFDAGPGDAGLAADDGGHRKAAKAPTGDAVQVH